MWLSIASTDSLLLLSYDKCALDGVLIGSQIYSTRYRPPTQDDSVLLESRPRRLAPVSRYSPSFLTAVSRLFHNEREKSEFRIIGGGGSERHYQDVGGGQK
jgi:hypothetical protein